MTEPKRRPSRTKMVMERKQMLTEQDKTNLEYSINKTLTEMQNDALSALIYDGKNMVALVRSKMEMYEALLEKVRKM